MLAFTLLAAGGSTVPNGAGAFLYTTAVLGAIEQAVAALTSVGASEVTASAATVEQAAGPGTGAVELAVRVRTRGTLVF